jgi:DNA polymerase bacteriophage-type
MRHVLCDFETASTCDLKECGAWRYAEDINTEILCLCWEFNGAMWRWTPENGTLLDEHGACLIALVRDPEVLFIAHNAGFEKAIWRRIMVPVFGFPDIPDERWHDTMAVCAYKALPLSLDKAVHVLGLPDEKDTAASRFTVALSKPSKLGSFQGRTEGLPRVLAYCEQDVRAEVALHNRIGWLSPAERKTWLLDQTINQRGVALDTTFCAKAQDVVSGAMQPMLAEFRTLTTGLNPTQTAKVLAWCKERGATLPNLQKATIAEALGYDIDGDWEPEQDDYAAPALVPAVREALSIRQLTASASIKKLPRMLASVCADGRTRGLLQYHGAGTGRWAGRLYQPQNFPKPVVFPPKGMKADAWQAMLVDAIMTGDPAYVEMLIGSPIETVISSLRYAVVAGPGCALAVGDFAGIEARVVLALAGQHDKTALIAQGLDPYLDFASVVLGRPVLDKSDPARNKTGKPGVLGCGFGMGAKKLAFKEGIPLEDAQKIIDTYRKEWAPAVPKLWYGLESAATKCVWEGTPQEAYGCTYRMEDGWLTVQMPSGRKLWYRDPEKCLRKMPWDEFDIRRGFNYKTQNAKGQWVTVNPYGGLLTENVVQALARDIMVYAMHGCERENLPVILTVHDEIICEAERPDALMLKQLMEDRPPWAVEMGLPIEAECWVGQRYRKG